MTFDDVTGVSEAKAKLQMIVPFLKAGKTRASRRSYSKGYSSGLPARRSPVPDGAHRHRRSRRTVLLDLGFRISEMFVGAWRDGLGVVGGGGIPLAGSAGR